MEWITFSTDPKNGRREERKGGRSDTQPSNLPTFQPFKMNLQRTLNTFSKRLFGRQPPRSRNTRALSGGRVSMQDPHRQHTMYHVAPPERSRSVWQMKNWTEEELLHLPVDQFMKVVTSISPEVNKAYKDFPTQRERVLGLPSEAEKCHADYRRFLCEA